MMMKSLFRTPRQALLGRVKIPCASFHMLLPSASGEAFAKKQQEVVVLSKAQAHTFKKVTIYSWAADRLKEVGEEIVDVPEEEIVEITEELLNNPAPKVCNLADEIFQLDFLEVNQLTNLIQGRLKITDEQMAAAMGVAGGGSAGGEAAAAVEKPKEKDAFSIKISAAVDAKAKIKVIKEVRAITGLGLKEAKELVEKAPVVVKEGVKKEDAENFKKILVESGAQIELV